MCFCGAGGGADGTSGSGGVDGSNGNSGVGGSVVYRSIEGWLFMISWHFCVGWVVLVEVVEVELVMGCVVRLLLWWLNGRGDFLWCFSLMLVEMNRLSEGVCLFEIVIWAECFVILEHDFLGKMVGADVVMEVVVEVVVVVAVDVVLAGFFVFFKWGCLGNRMGARVVMEIVVGVVMLVW